MKKCERCGEEAVENVQLCTSCGHTPSEKPDYKDLIGALKMSINIARASNLFEDFIPTDDYFFIRETIKRAIKELENTKQGE